MRPDIPKNLRKQVSDIVRDLEGVPDSLQNLSPSFQSVLPDIIHFNFQIRTLQLESARNYVAFFEDSGRDQDMFPVLVQVPDLRNASPSYNSLLSASTSM